MGLALLGAVVCSPAAPSTYPVAKKTASQEKRELVEKLELETIALVRQTESNFLAPYCSGVWVDYDKIITALHCVKDELSENGAVNLFLYQVKDDEGKPGRKSKIIKTDDENDLALLLADPKTIPLYHPVAIPADESWDGEHINIVGHTNGLWWTYIEGVISSTRINTTKEGIPIVVLQISSPVWFGNSGGGAFNDEGRLVGISSWISLKVPLMSFFIHHSTLIRLDRKKLQ